MNEKAIEDISGLPVGEPDYWDPIIFTGEEIAAEIDRLAALPRPVNGRRESSFIHPRSSEPGRGLAPGIRVTLAVLLPGERTRPIRHTSTQVGFCISGGGQVVVESDRIDFGRYDVWNIPCYRTYWYENHTDVAQVRLHYSNAPLLEKLHVHIVDDNPPETSPLAPADTESVPSSERVRHTPFDTFQLHPTGASLMPYETVIDPPSVESRALHWPWTGVKYHLDQLEALGADYVGRRLYLLYNPATERTNGTTPSFFATMTVRPPGVADRPHRHVSAAINYFFHGSGYSRIAGQRYEWKAGDLMLTAPGWVIHGHASNADDSVYELTIQDQPLHIAMESLLWQEDLKKPARVLGADVGFATNRPVSTLDGVQ